MKPQNGNLTSVEGKPEPLIWGEYAQMTKQNAVWACHVKQQTLRSWIYFRIYNIILLCSFDYLLMFNYSSEFPLMTLNYECQHRICLCIPPRSQSAFKVKSDEKWTKFEKYPNSNRRWEWVIQSTTS